MTPLDPVAYSASPGSQAELSELRQALGLLTTLHPQLVMDADHPLAMARAIAQHVEAERHARVAASPGVDPFSDSEVIRRWRQRAEKAEAEVASLTQQLQTWTELQEVITPDVLAFFKCRTPEQVIQGLRGLQERVRFTEPYEAAQTQITTLRALGERWRTRSEWEYILSNGGEPDASVVKRATLRTCADELAASLTGEQP